MKALRDISLALGHAVTTGRGQRREQAGLCKTQGLSYLSIGGIQSDDG
jgi:hypothetical protein